MQNCPKCGAQNDAAAKFCAKCGAPMTPSVAQPSVAPSAPVAAVQPFDYYTGAFRKYTVIDGRAQRAEYWYFVLFSFLISAGLSILDKALGLDMGSKDGNGVLSAIYSLATIIPSICIGVRRIHDTNHSGWWVIVPFVNLYFLIIDGTKGPNTYGVDPKGRAAEPAKV